MKAEIEFLHNELAIFFLSKIHTFMWLNFDSNVKGSKNEIISPVSVGDAIKILKKPLKDIWDGYVKLLDIKYGINTAEEAFKNDMNVQALEEKNEVQIIKSKGKK